MDALFNRFTLTLTKDQARDASHQGQCYEDAKALSENPKVKKQLDKIAPEDIAAELKECGAWDAEELQDAGENRIRLVWLAACDIREEYGL